MQVPSAPRENYSLLVMESTGMMKMATGEGFPLRQGARTGLDWFLVAIEACGSGTPDLLCSPMFLGYMDIYRRKKYVRGATRGPRGWRVRPLPRGSLVSFLACTPSLSGSFPSKNNFSSWFHSVSTPFNIPFLRNKGKNRNWHWALGQ